MKTMSTSSVKRTLTALIAVTLALIITTYSLPVSAVGEPPSPEDALESYRLDTAWYDPNATQCLLDGDSSLVGSDNVEKAFNFFISKGLTPVQTAGILGNFLQESGMNPAIHQNNASDSPFPTNTVGFGIAQWTFTSRQQPLVELADSKGVLPNTLPVQLDYVWQELEGSHNHALVDLEEQTTVEGATESFHRIYEGSADNAAQIQERVDDAKRVLAKYGATAPAEGGGTPASSCGGAGILVGDYSFPLAPQTKRNYGYTLPCKQPILNGPYTVDGVYTDYFGQSTRLRPCHHDATAAFDLSYGNVGRKPIYAITRGYITYVNPAYSSGIPEGRTCNSITFKADTENDKSYYWYGHIIATRSASTDRVIDAGEVIGYVAPAEYGPRCWSGGVHLHIDRGCVIGGSRENYLVDGDPQTPGRIGCRDPGFIDDLYQIWEALQEE